MNIKTIFLLNNILMSNSPLQTIIAGHSYVRICGLAMDDSKNLWLTQTGVIGSIKVLKPDGTWIVISNDYRCTHNQAISLLPLKDKNGSSYPVDTDFLFLMIIAPLMSSRTINV